MSQGCTENSRQTRKKSRRCGMRPISEKLGSDGDRCAYTATVGARHVLSQHRIIAVVPLGTGAKSTTRVCPANCANERAQRPQELQTVLTECLPTSRPQPPMNTVSEPSAIWPPHEIGSPILPAGLPLMNTELEPAARLRAWSDSFGRACEAKGSPSRTAARPSMLTSGDAPVHGVGGAPSWSEA